MYNKICTFNLIYLFTLDVVLSQETKVTISPSTTYAIMEIKKPPKIIDKAISSSMIYSIYSDGTWVKERNFENIATLESNLDLEMINSNEFDFGGYAKLRVKNGDKVRDIVAFKECSWTTFGLSKLKSDLKNEIIRQKKVDEEVIGEIVYNINFCPKW
ncbi:MAG: hypothetical protein IPH93_15005 [Saprospiraceae bacterium]|nr:hypothetical protein [Saprospiraceae bacterium]MBK7810814.1 hypothetical protein [Saprospiraceae bacterium]